ncbi:MAG TPA: hypothetical protein VHB20_17875 [Verrucomicrobiae bacterium]|jgi:hypothetical protein|nr:hypothetical protein [Verrucomicrobiae bacterium]
MSSQSHPGAVPSLDLSKWRNVPTIMIVIGAIGALAAFAVGGVRQFAFSWLLGFMFVLSLGLGGLFLVIVHHLFDASWSVPIRRFNEHIACLSGPTLLVLFIPVAILAPKIYPWMGRALQSHPDHALTSKAPLFTYGGFYISAAVCFALWWLISHQLRGWSLKQDKSGSAECTHKMRFYACIGVVIFALTLTTAAIMWIKGLMHEWYSTMFGVWYFAASVWTTLATVYAITLVMQRTTPLRNLIREKTYYMIGSLMLAFTIFYAYISFAQYFIIWNANIPEETFWFVLREKGWWWGFGQIIIFGHFFVPFLALLRIDVKLKPQFMIPLCGWAWLMHFCDLEFQIMPALNEPGAPTLGIFCDACCVLLMAGVLAKVFLYYFAKYAPYPQWDPRMAEALDVYVPPTHAYATAPGRAK